MSAEDNLLRLFPGLNRDHLQITSPETPQYNCVAFVAGDTATWWEPDQLKYCYWPRGVTRAYTTMAYQAAFETLDFVITGDSSFRQGFEKIAIFHKDSVPAHVAKQTSDGLWSSKLGQSFDIAHDLEGMQGLEYGEIAFFMERPRRQ